MSIARYFNPRLRERLVSHPHRLPGWLERHPRKKYIISCVLATVSWGDREKLKQMRDEARRLTAETGIRHVLDHVIPLTHPYVCGLNTPENMQILPYKVNAVKGNNWHPDQMVLL